MDQELSVKGIVPLNHKKCVNVMMQWKLMIIS